MSVLHFLFCNYYPFHCIECPDTSLTNFVVWVSIWFSLIVITDEGRNSETGWFRSYVVSNYIDIVGTVNATSGQYVNVTSSSASLSSFFEDDKHNTKQHDEGASYKQTESQTKTPDENIISGKSKCLVDHETAVNAMTGNIRDTENYVEAGFKSLVLPQLRT